MMTLTRLLRPAHRSLFAVLLTALTATALAGPTPAATAVTATASVSAYPVMSTGSYERNVQHWINVRRVNRGLHRLRIADCTDNVAERWGRYLATNDEFYHQSMSTILNRCDASYAGETLGRGAISPKRLVRMWMHSPTHRSILLSRHPRRLGIGAYPDSYGQWVVAADFMRF
jgi:uncharacterized protein YkwD